MIAGAFAGVAGTLYAFFSGTISPQLADWTAYSVDKTVVDGAYNGVATLIRRGGGQLRRLQTGYVRNYALGVAAGTVLLLAYVVVRAGA